MSELFIRLHLFLARHRGALLALTVGFALLALFLTPRLRLNEDYTDMLPMSDPAIASQVAALQRVRQVNLLFVDIAATSADAELLAEAASKMEDALAGIPELSDIRGAVDASQAQELLDSLQQQLPLLLTAETLHELEPRLVASTLHDRLAWYKKNLAQPQGLMLQRALLSDPVGLADSILASLRTLQAGAGDAQLVGGRVTSADGRHVLITALPAFPPSDTGRSRALLARVLGEARRVEAAFLSSALRIAVSGAHRISLDNAAMIQRDSMQGSLIATVAVAILMLGVFRHRWLSVLGLLPPALGGLASVLAFYFTGQPVSAVALGCGSILIGLTVDYGIYVLYHSDDSPPATREGMARAVAAMVPTVSFGALTTLAAFLVMLLSPVSGHRQLGWFGVVAVLTAALIALFLLPVLVPTTDPSGAQRARAGLANARPTSLDRTRTSPASAQSGAAYTPLPLTDLMQRLLGGAPAQGSWMVLALLLFTLVCGAGLVRLRFDGDLNRFNGVTAATAGDEQQIRDTWGSALSLTTVVVSGATREEALQQNERLYAVLGELQRSNVLTAVSSLAPLLPSAKSRESNLEAWSAFWSSARLADLSNSLHQSGITLGFRQGAFSNFLTSLASSRDPVPVRSPGVLGRLLENFSSEQGGSFSFLTLVKPADARAYGLLRERLASELPDALVLNRAALGQDISRIARRGLPLFAGMVIVLNAVLLFLFLGRVSLVLITLLPMAAGVFWTLGVLGLAGIPVDISNFIFVTLVIGLCGDYSLFLVMAEVAVLRRSVGASRTATSAGAVTLCAFTTIFGVGVLALARHPALFSVGVSALLGITFSLVASLMLVPRSMGWLRRRADLASTTAVQSGGLSATDVARRVAHLYRFQQPYVAQFTAWKMRLDPLFQHLDSVVPPAATVLDLGCGYGLAAHWLTLTSTGRTVVGLDSDVAKMQVAQATAYFNPRVRFEMGDVLNAEYPACDCVLMLDLLHYLPHKFKERVLEKAASALRPGGVLVMRDAFSENSRRHRLVAFSEKWAVRLGQNKTAHGLHFETGQAHLEMIARAGFQSVVVKSGAGFGSNGMLVCRKPAGVATGG